MIQTISVYDVAHNPEAFYHGFMLGLAAGIDQKQYELKSNRESDLGRYDIAIIPKDTTKPAIILEIKSISPPRGAKNKEKVLASLLSREAKKALEQINRNQYTVDLVQRGFLNIVKIGLVFSGKEFRVKSESNDRQ
ncbi:MAG: PD-(D/E)XK nuclease domain-containing protein [Coxiellaceae bacterium]|nr:PD-(D/E)XK nuclease domain-containing protein [Coxiellaceae bacterium]